MAEYLHGAYGRIADSGVQSAAPAVTVPVYIGTAPVNLIRGFADKPIINRPVKIASLSDAQAKIGDSEDWESFTLCEAVAAHFDGDGEGVGPIYVINVLDPTAHKKKTPSTLSAPLANGRYTFVSDRIILDTLEVSYSSDATTKLVEGTDYTVAYSIGNHAVTIIVADEEKASATLSLKYSECDPASVTVADIVGTVSENGARSGIDAVALLYQEQFAIANILAAPGWSHNPEVYRKLLRASERINGHWDAFVMADLPVSAGASGVSTIAAAKAWKAEHSYNSERSSVWWPLASDARSRTFHLSTLAVVASLRTDAENDGIPFESCSNKPVSAVKQCFGDAQALPFDQTAANGLNEEGIGTIVGWAGSWVLWGPHTAAYDFGTTPEGDRSVFAPTMRMLMHITNSFQQDWAESIDEPMTHALQDRIVNREQEKLDALVTVGALTGEPKVSFDEASNPASDISEGSFRWDLSATPTPPLKSATVVVAYTAEGYASYFGGDE